MTCKRTDRLHVTPKMIECQMFIGGISVLRLDLGLMLGVTLSCNAHEFTAKTMKFALYFLLSLGSITSLNAQPKNHYLELRDQIDHVQLDTASIRSVDGLFYEHGLISMILDSGSIALIEPIGSNRVGVVFIGKGSVTFRPNMATERTNLQRFVNTDVFVVDISTAVYVTTDTAFLALVNDLPKGGSSEGMTKLINAQWPSLTMGEADTLMNDAIAKTFLNGYKKDFMLMRIGTRSGTDAIIAYNPYSIEPYMLELRKHREFTIDSPILVCQCSADNEQAATTDDGVDDGDLVRTLSHTLKIDIERDFDLTGIDRVEMAVNEDSLRWVNFDLYPTLKVDSITIVRPGTTSAESISFFRAKNSATAWVELPQSLHRDNKFTLIFYYHGDVIERIEDYSILVTSMMWYPAHSYFHKTLFDIAFTYPASMTLASVGRRTTDTTIDDRHHARWESGHAIRNCSFHIGFFKRNDVAASGGAPKAVVLYKTTNQADIVTQDIQQSLLFFSKLYGKLSIDSLIATELPGNHGESFPGLLHLSSQTFFTADDNDFFTEQFIAHEVAHQWWGSNVDFKSYRDQWLSEGFAEYSALMYSQLAAADSKKFFNLLESYRTKILSFGKRFIGKNLPPPAISLGYRVDMGATEPGAYSIFVYSKGAWVLHMLRNMMININTMDENTYFTVMRTFYSRYKGKRTSTREFQQTIEELTGANLEWFFDQWVYGNQIPTYTYAWKKEQQADGKWKITMRVKQADVPISFKMFIPLKITFDDESHMRLRIVVTGDVSTLELPLFDKEPDEFTFNDLSSVLCEVAEESF